MVNKFEKKSYGEILDYLYNQLPMFQRSGPAAYKNSLGNTLALDEFYGHPHQNYKTIHVAGTNGKGSVSHLLAAILQEAGYKTGLYTSPHLKDFRERIRLNGKKISEEFVACWVNNFMEKNKDWKLEPSFFELASTMAFDYFSVEKAGVAVVEVGLGGRLDSTNIIMPEVSIITNISFDHTNLLGNTLEEIAGEKAGIIKPGIPVVIGQSHPETKDVFINKAVEVSAPIFFADKEYFSDYSMIDSDGKQTLNVSKGNHVVFQNLKTGLGGIYQRQNIPTVLKACDILKEKGWKIADESIYSGISEVVELTGLQGRWQVLGHNPLVICDTGHNEGGIRMVVEQIRQTPHKKLHFVLGVVGDKDMSKVFALLPKDAVYYFTKAAIPRALDENLLKEQASVFGLSGKTFPAVAAAYKAAKENAQPEDLIFVGGSTFVVAEVLP
jgi:dihydrofolate synthase / folylpolyglutamate synthase